MNKIVMVVGTSFLLFCRVAAIAAPSEPIKLGWIGAMTGPLAKYGAHNAAILAVEDVNRNGGIRGRQISLVFEDSQGQGKVAVSAARKLLNVDKVPAIVGGHCSPESLPIAPIMKQAKRPMLAAITSSPKLSNSGPYVFRISPVNTLGPDLVIPFAVAKGHRRLAVLAEDTDYAGPLAEYAKQKFVDLGGEVPVFERYSIGETDFRPLLLKVRAANVQALYLSVQTADSVILFSRQLQELGLSLPTYGNEIIGTTVASRLTRASPLNGLVYAEPAFDPESPETKSFISAYTKRFGGTALPQGIWTAEAYDAVRVMADAIERCGVEPDEIAKCLADVVNFPGASGTFSINASGDGARKYVLKTAESSLDAPLSN